MNRKHQFFIDETLGPNRITIKAGYHKTSMSLSAIAMARYWLWSLQGSGRSLRGGSRTHGKRPRRFWGPAPTAPTLAALAAEARRPTRYLSPEFLR